MAQGVPSEQIIVVAGHRQYHAEQFKQRLFQVCQQPLGALQLKVFPAWGHDLLRQYSHLLTIAPARVLRASETLFLLRYFYRLQGPAFFSEPLRADAVFFRHLLRRHQRCAEHLFTYQELSIRSQTLEYAEVAQQANGFLAAFDQWLKAAHLLGPMGQATCLLELAALPQVQAAFAGFYWLIDDLDETRPLEQSLYQLLGQQARQIVYAANPQGGTERLLGAYPEYLQSLQVDTSIQLEARAAYGPLADKLTALFQHQAPDDEALQAHAEVQLFQHPTPMYEAMGLQIRQLLQAGTPGDSIVCLTWFLDQATERQLEAHFNKLGIPVEILRGNHTLQRHPLVNTLLSLIRLVLWQALKEDPRLPRLNGLDMSQILEHCARLSPFEVSQLRFVHKDQLESWGAYLKTAQQPLIKQLQHWVSSLRQAWDEGQLTSLSELALALWKQLLLPELALEQRELDNGFQQLNHLLETLAAFEDFKPALAADFEKELIYQLMQEEILMPVRIQGLRNRKVKVMTLYRVCELKYESDFQLWFDLSSAAWSRPVNHPLDNALLLSRAWPLEQPWTLAAEEEFTQQRLALTCAKGLRYIQRQAYFYAAQYDLQAKLQLEEQLIEHLRYSP